MRALLDVNVLIALLDSDHVSHTSAIRWFAANAGAGWASCAITQNGCIRTMSNPGYPNPLPVQALVEHLREACRQQVHEFWDDDVSLLDSGAVDSGRIHGPRQLTGTYLLALAAQHGGRLVTFDDGIALTAVRQATARTILIL